MVIGNAPPMEMAADFFSEMDDHLRDVFYVKPKKVVKKPRPKKSASVSPAWAVDP